MPLYPRIFQSIILMVYIRTFFLIWGTSREPYARNLSFLPNFGQSKSSGIAPFLPYMVNFARRNGAFSDFVVDVAEVDMVILTCPHIYGNVQNRFFGGFMKTQRFGCADLRTPMYKQTNSLSKRPRSVLNLL